MEKNGDSGLVIHVVNGLFVKYVISEDCSFRCPVKSLRNSKYFTYMLSISMDKQWISKEVAVFSASQEDLN